MDYEFRYTYTEIGLRDSTAQHHYRVLNPDNLQFGNRPIIIGISGNGATKNEDANGFTKIIQTYLDLMFKTKDGKNALDYVDIMGIKYASRSKQGGNGYVTKNFANQLTDAMIKLLTDQNGKLLSLDQACQNFSRLTFFTYCQGNFSLNDIIDLLNEKLLDLGYTTDEITAINNASMEVSFAALNPVDNKIPSVRILSINDPVVFSDLDYLVATDPKIKNLNGIALHQDQPGYLYGKPRAGATAPSIQIISSNLLNAYSGFHVVYNDHNINCLSFNQDWKLKPCEIHGKNLVSLNAQCAAELMALSLCAAVQHSLDNLTAPSYQPNRHWHQLPAELQYNIDSYAPVKLAFPTANFTGLKQQNSIEK